MTKFPNSDQTDTDVELDTQYSNHYSAVQTSETLTNEESDSYFKRFLQKFKGGVIGGLERFFLNYGKFIASKPIFFIVLSLFITLVCAIGPWRHGFVVMWDYPAR